MALKEKSLAVFNYVKENGGKVEITDMAEALGVSVRSINGTVTALGCKGPHAKGLVDREKVSVEGAEKPITYVVLTDKGMNFDPTAEENAD